MKESIDQMKATKIICDYCRDKMVKLRTTVGREYVHKGKIYQNMYWVCICTNDKCEENFVEKILLTDITEIQFYPLMGRYNDRSRLCGR